MIFARRSTAHSVQRVFALLVLLALGACGGESSQQGTSGRARNESTTKCFASQSEKDAVVAAAQSALDAASSATTIAQVADTVAPGETVAPTETSVADNTALQDAVQTATDTPICELNVAPVSDPSVSECTLTVVDNGATVDVSVCDSVTKLSVGPLADGQWQEVAGNSVMAAAIGDSRTISYKAWVGEIVVAEGSWNLDATDNVGTFAVQAAQDAAKPEVGTVSLDKTEPLIGETIIATATSECVEVASPNWWEYSLAQTVNGSTSVDEVAYGAIGKLRAKFTGDYTVTATNFCNTTQQPIIATISLTVIGGTAPANDTFSAALELSGQKGTTTANTGATTSEPNEPNHGCFGPHGSTWFRWIATEDGSLRVDTIGSSFDSLFAVYTGNGLSNLTKVAGANKGGDHGAASTSVDVQAKKQYYIATDGCGSNGKLGQQGVLTLSWVFTPSSAPPAAAATPPASATVIADAIGTLGVIQLQEGVTALTFDKSDNDQILAAAQLAAADVYVQSGVQEWTKINPLDGVTQLNIGENDTQVEVAVRPHSGSVVNLSIGIERKAALIAGAEATGGASESGSNLLVRLIGVLVLLAAGYVGFDVFKRRKVSVVQIVAVVVVVGLGAGLLVIRSTNSVKLESVSTTLRPLTDGFSFPNFPASVSSETFDVNDLVAMFAGGACVGGNVDPCVPTAEAAAWARMVNQARASGHCEGLVVQAASRFAASVNPKTVDLPNEGEITHGIFRAFATQFLPETQADTDSWAKKSLRQIVNGLVESFKTGSAQYAMGLYTDKGGHAVLPYAIDFTDSDHAVVQVYDSNWPGKNRFVEIDLAKKEWRFSFSGKDPANDPKAWTGGEGYLDLTSMASRATGTCPFCGNDTKVKNTMLVIKSTDASWSIKTKNGTVSPGAGTTVDGVVVKPLRGAVGDVTALEYVVFVDGTDMELNLPAATSAFVMQENAIVQVLSSETDNAPVVISQDAISVDDPSVNLTVASDNLVASVAGSNTVVGYGASELNVSIESSAGQQLQVVVNAQTPQVTARAVDTTDAGGSNNFVVTSQTADNQTQVREVRRDGTENVTTAVGSVGLNTVSSVLPPALQSEIVRPGLPALETRNLANPLYQADVPYVPQAGLIVSNMVGSRACDLPGFPPDWIIQPNSPTCTAPTLTIASASATQNAVGTSCSLGSVAGTWTRFGAAGSVTCLPNTATAIAASSVAGRQGTACSEYGVVGTWEYVGAGLMCQPMRATNSAISRAGSPCTLAEFPSFWVFSPSGTGCIAPVVGVAASRSPGTGCSEGGMPGTWTYANGSASLVCMPYTTAAAVRSVNYQAVGSLAAGCSNASWYVWPDGRCLATPPPVGTFVTATAAATANAALSATCVSRGFPANWAPNASGSCTAPVMITTTANGPVGSACFNGGVPGTWQYASGSADMNCVSNTGAVAVAGIVGSSCSSAGITGTWQYVTGSTTISCSPNAGFPTARSSASNTSCASRGFPATWSITATGSCVAPIASGVSTGGGQVGAGCSVNGMPGTWMYAGGTATLTCMPVTAAAASTTATGSATSGAASQLGSVCTSNGQTGYTGYIGAVISCVITATITTTVNTRSCAQDGYPPTWTRASNGSCISPIDISTPMTIGGGCLVGGMPGTYGYSGANIVCFPNTAGLTTPVATAPSTALTPTIGSYCLSGALPGSYQYVGASITCVATATTPVATAPSTGFTPTLGSACPLGGSTGYYQYVGASIVCIATTTTTTWSTAPVATAPSTGITPTLGSYCLTGGVPGSYRYVGATIMCVATTTTPVATAPSTGFTPTLGSACPLGGSTGYYQYVGASIVCIATTTTTTWSTAPVATAPSTGIAPTTSTVATTPTTVYVSTTTSTTIYVATTTTSTLPPTCPAVTPYMWTDGSCRATRQF
jgi:hypothetical protein